MKKDKGKWKKIHSIPVQYAPRALLQRAIVQAIWLRFWQIQISVVVRWTKYYFLTFPCKFGTNSPALKERKARLAWAKPKPKTSNRNAHDRQCLLQAPCHWPVSRQGSISFLFSKLVAVFELSAHQYGRSEWNRTLSEKGGKPGPKSLNDGDLTKWNIAPVNQPNCGRPSDFLKYVVPIDHRLFHYFFDVFKNSLPAGCILHNSKNNFSWYG